MIEKYHSNGNAKDKYSEQETSNVSCGERIKQARQIAELTQKELGDLIGRTVHAVRKWEQGSTEPSLDLLHKIAVATNVPFAFIVGGSSSLWVAYRDKTCPFHAGVEALKNDSHTRKLWNVSDEDINTLRDFILPDQQEEYLTITTIPEALRLLSFIRALRKGNAS